MVIIQLVSVQNPELSPTVLQVFPSNFLQLSIHELSNTFCPVLSNRVSDWLRVKATFLTDKVEEIKWYYNISRVMFMEVQTAHLDLKLHQKETWEADKSLLLDTESVHI